MINIEFLVVAYFISLFVDWVFQWNWQAINKSKWSKYDDHFISFIAVFTHSLVYSFLTVWGLLLFKVITRMNFEAIIVVIVLFVTHMIIDTRIPVKWIMRFKGMSWEQINDGQAFGFMHIGIDHRLHELVLLILSCYIQY